MIRRSILLLSALILAGCGILAPTPTVTPTALSSPTPVTPTLVPTFPPPPTLAPSPSPSPTPLPTLTPTPPIYAASGTPLPTNLPVISYQNAALVSGLAEWQEEQVVDLAWAPDGLTLAVANYAAVSFYEVQTRTRQNGFQADEGIASIAFSPNGRYLATGYSFGSEIEGLAGEVDFWRAPDWEQIRVLYNDNQGVSEVSFASIGSPLAVAFSNPINEENQVLFMDAYSWEITQTLKTGAVLKIAFSPDGKLFASTPDRYALKLWQTKDGKLLRKTNTSFTGAVNSLAFSPDGTLIASGHYDGEIRIWDVEKGTLLHTLDAGGVVECLAFSPDSTILASGDSYENNAIYLWDSVTGVRLNVLMGHPKGLQALAFSPNGQVLASASFDGNLRLWGIRP